MSQYNKSDSSTNNSTNTTNKRFGEVDATATELQTSKRLKEEFKEDTAMIAGMAFSQPEAYTTASNSQSSTTQVLKRQDAICWDDYFMAIAFLSAQRSKDPNSQVGACIVDEHKKIVGIGYNGFPFGCSDDEFPWARHGPIEDTKYPYVVHAEVNAIVNKNAMNIRGSCMYVALFPCNDCAKIIIQSGISEVVYMSDKYHDDYHVVASRRMLEVSGVKLRQYTPTKTSITVDFTSIEKNR